MDADPAPRHAAPRAHGENFVQWTDLTIEFSPEHTRAGDRADAPIGLLMDADDVATNAVAAVQMDAAKARAVGDALVWFAARLDAESGTDHRGGPRRGLGERLGRRPRRARARRPSVRQPTPHRARRPHLATHRPRTARQPRHRPAHGRRARARPGRVTHVPPPPRPGGRHATFGRQVCAARIRAERADGALTPPSTAGTATPGGLRIVAPASYDPGHGAPEAGHGPISCAAAAPDVGGGRPHAPGRNEAEPRGASPRPRERREETMTRTEAAAVNAETRSDFAALPAARLSAELGTAREVLARWAPRRDALGCERWPNRHAPDLWATSCVHAGMIRAELARRAARPGHDHPRPERAL